MKDMANDTGCTIAALQETKLHNIQAADVSETLGQKFSNNFAFLPAQGTKGGALIAVDEDFYPISHKEHREHVVSICVECTQSMDNWWITMVYGPQEDREKIDFLHEL